MSIGSHHYTTWLSIFFSFGISWKWSHARCSHGVFYLAHHFQSLSLIRTEVQPFMPFYCQEQFKVSTSYFVSTHSSVSGHLSCLYHLVIKNDAISTIFMWKYILSWWLFNNLRDWLPTTFESSCVVAFLHSSLQEGSHFFTFFLTFITCFLLQPYLCSVKRYLTVVLLCMYLLADAVEHLFKCLWTICFRQLPWHIFCPYCSWVSCAIIDFQWLPILSGRKVVLTVLTCKYFLPLCGCLFSVKYKFLTSVMSV